MQVWKTADITCHAEEFADPQKSHRKFRKHEKKAKSSKFIFGPSRTAYGKERKLVSPKRQKRIPKKKKPAQRKTENEYRKYSPPSADIV